MFCSVPLKMTGYWRISKIVFLILMMVGGGFAGDSLPDVEPGAQAREVVLLYTNDFESAYDPIPAFWRDDMESIGGIAELAALIEAERAKAPLSFLLDAGDIFTGTLAKLTHGELPFELMITMNYDVMCIGNHEFEYGWWVLRDAMHRAPFPVLAANLFYEGTEIPFTQPSTILERGLLQVSGLRVEYDLSEPIGERVQKVGVGDRPLDRSATYSVTTPDFLASGADLYSGFTEGEVVIDDGPQFADLLEKYFAETVTVAAPTRGRLIPVR